MIPFRNKNIIFMFAVCLFSHSCDSTDKIIVINESNRWLLFTYPDDCQLPSALPNWKLFGRENFDDIVAPHSEKDIEIIGSWEQTIAKEYKDGKFCLYFFDLVSLESNPWETIRQRNLYLEKYTVDVASLKASNWQITFDYK